MTESQVEHSEIIVVSGLPRSGTSLMMKMLAAGGVPVLTDGLRAADEDNPEGYFELEQVKELDKGNQAWLAGAQGKAVKIISALLQFLPLEHTYKVIFMQRRLSEVLASQQRMLVRRGEAQDAISDEKLTAIYARHLQQIQGWLAAQPNVSFLNVDYNALVIDPQDQIGALTRFLGGALDAEAMAGVIRPQLYRNRTES